MNECAENIAGSIINAAKESIPNKAVTIRPSEPQRINSQIKRENRKRKRLFRNAKRKNTDAHWNKFKQKRNEVTILIRDAKKQYKDKLANDLINSNNNPRRWHILVSQIINPQSNKHSIPFLETDENIIESNHEIAEALNNFFH